MYTPRGTSDVMSCLMDSLAVIHNWSIDIFYIHVCSYIAQYSIFFLQTNKRKQDYIKKLSDSGVIILHLFHYTTDGEAHFREACLIEAIGEFSRSIHIEDCIIISNSQPEAHALSSFSSHTLPCTLTITIIFFNGFLSLPSLCLLSSSGPQNLTNGQYSYPEYYYPQHDPEKRRLFGAYLLYQAYLIYLLDNPQPVTKKNIYY